jgi:hypothetical protein
MTGNPRDAADAIRALPGRTIAAFDGLRDVSDSRPANDSSGRPLPAAPRPDGSGVGCRADGLRERHEREDTPMQQTEDRQARRDDDRAAQTDSPQQEAVEGGPSGGSQHSPPEPNGEETEETQPTLPLDQVFEILKNSRRRETLQYLRAHDGEATLSDVAEHIAAIENDTTVQAISSTQRKRVYVGLYQCHLPKMDDIGVVDFDKNRGSIELEPVADQLYEYLEDEQSRDWHRLYLAIALAGAGLFVLALAGAASYGLTPAVVLGGLLVTITGCSAAHALTLRD